MLLGCTHSFCCTVGIGKHTNSKIFHFLSIYHCGKFRMPRSQEAAFENFKQDKWMCPAAIASANFLPSTSAGKKPLSAPAPTDTETKSSPRLISIVRRRESDLCVCVEYGRPSAPLSDRFHSSLRRRLACQ